MIRIRRTLMIATLTAAALLSGAAVPATAAPMETCRAEDGHAAAFDGRRTFLLDPAEMRAMKERAESEPEFVDAKRKLVAEADAALEREPYTVIQKKALPPSGDLHDYLSIGPYWWPDPSKPNGMPFIRKDGEFNPDRGSEKYDRARLEAMSSDVEILALAYYFTDEQRYAQQAAKLLRIWFIYEQTRMNPNLNFAQAIPGRETGRAEGIIDTSRLQRVVEAIGLIGPSGMLRQEDQRGLEQWFSDYIDWMMTSENGQEEDAAANNHALWYDSQIAQFALFARRPDVTERVARNFANRRIAPQFAVDGSLPRELSRTRSLHYSVFALAAAFDVAELGQCVGVDLWSYADGEGRGLRNATDFLAAYVGRIGQWPYREISPDPDELNQLLVRAESHWPEANYRTDPQRAALRKYFKLR